MVLDPVLLIPSQIMTSSTCVVPHYPRCSILTRVNSSLAFRTLAGQILRMRIAVVSRVH
jgi:hypothetical protein